MTRRQTIIIGVIAGVLAVAALALYAIGRRDAWTRAAPAWLNPSQPADGVAAELSTLTVDQSWAANRARHMTGCCTDQTAGTRVRRTYPSTLAESDCSIVKGQLSLQVGR